MSDGDQPNQNTTAGNPAALAAERQALQKQAAEIQKQKDALQTEIDAVNEDLLALGTITALDVAGTLEPTPSADLSSAAISFYRGDWWGGTLSIVSVVPYLGDLAAKPIKAGRAATQVAKANKTLVALQAKMNKMNKKLAAAEEKIAKAEEKYQAAQDAVQRAEQLATDPASALEGGLGGGSAGKRKGRGGKSGTKSQGAKEKAENAKKTADANCSGKPPPKGTQGCEKDKPPKPIVLQMDCTGYPDDVPLFRMAKSPERWIVRATKDGGGSTRRDKSGDDFSARERAFKKRIAKQLDKNKKLPDEDIERLQNVLWPLKLSKDELSRMNADEIVKAISDLNLKYKEQGHSNTYKPNYHHLQPTWAGGKTTPDNIYPALPGHQTAGVHRWWDRKIKQAAEKLSKSEQAILKGRAKKKPPIPGVKEFSEKNIGRMAERASKADPRRVLVVKMTCPEAAGGWDKPLF